MASDDDDEGASPGNAGAAAPPAPVGWLILGPGAGESVAGVPVGARAAILLQGAGCARVAAVGSRERLGERAAWVEPAGEIPRRGPIVLVVGDVVFDEALVERLLASAIDGAPALERTPSGFVLAADSSVARMVLGARERGMLDGALGSISGDGPGETGAGVILPAATPAERSAATRAFLASAQGRPVSRAIARVLLSLPVAPGAMTTLSLLLGLAGAALLATAETRLRAIGAGLYLLAGIAGGCHDGIARAKLLDSRSGRTYETAASVIVGVGALAGIAVGVWRQLGSISPEVQIASILLAVGVALALAAFGIVSRRPRPAGSGGAREWLEWLAGLNWGYPLLALALVDQLPLFLYGSAIGSNVFAVLYLVFGVLAWRRA